jgi:class I lanthipeptide synthase
VGWGADLAAPATSSPASLPEALDRDRTRLRAGYRVLVDSPAFREALFVASPDLDETLDLWRRMPDSQRGQAVERALTRYLTRSAARATPFGLFASTSLGTIVDTTNLTIAPLSSCRRHTRLDVDYLVLLVEALERDAGLRDVLRYFPNSSLYAAGDRLRYVETRLQDKARSYHLVALEASEALGCDGPSPPGAGACARP